MRPDDGRRLLYDAWAAPYSATPLWPPELPQRFTSEERHVAAPGELALAGYVGEHHAFAMMCRGCDSHMQNLCSRICVHPN